MVKLYSQTKFTGGTNLDKREKQTIGEMRVELEYRAIIGKIIVEVSRVDGELAQRLIDEYL